MLIIIANTTHKMLISL